MDSEGGRDNEGGGLSRPELERFFAAYADGFNQALAGRPDFAAMTGRFAEVFVAAGPNGVEAGKNDSDFPEVLEKGLDFYRGIGTKRMTVQGIDVTSIDALHALVTVHWDSEYEPREGREVSIAFEVHYLMQGAGGAPRIFGFIAGDEQALLRQHGLI